MIVVRKTPKQYGAFADELEGPFETGVAARRSSQRARCFRGESAVELNLKVTVHAVVSRGLAPVNCPTVLPTPRQAQTDN